MNIPGKITIRIDRDSSTIEIKDPKSIITFLTITLTPEQLSRALFREHMVECEMETKHLDLVGKQHEWKKFEFVIPEHILSNSSLRRDEKPILLARVAQNILDVENEGWIADTNFSSQDSYFDKDGISYARCTIRRWV